MPEGVAWSIAVGAAGGAGVAASDKLELEALTSAVVEVGAGDTRSLAFQLEDVTRIELLAVTCSRYDGSVHLKGAGADDVEIALKGPVLAFGAAVARLAAKLGTVTVRAADEPAQPATVRILIGSRLS